MTKVQTPLGERLQRRRVVIEMVIDMEIFCELPCFGLERHGKDVYIFLNQEKSTGALQMDP